MRPPSACDRYSYKAVNLVISAKGRNGSEAVIDFFSISLRANSAFLQWLSEKNPLLLRQAKYSNKRQFSFCLDN